MSSYAISAWMREGGNLPLLIYWTAERTFVHDSKLEKEALAAVASMDLDPAHFYRVVLVSVQHQHEHLFTEMGLFPTLHSHMLVSLRMNDLQATLLLPELQPRVLQPPQVVPLPQPIITPCLVTLTARTSLVGKALFEYASVAAKQLNLTSYLRELPYSRRWSSYVRTPSLWLYPHKECEVPLEYAGPIHSARILTFLKSNLIQDQAVERGRSSHPAASAEANVTASGVAAKEAAVATWVSAEYEHVAKQPRVVGQVQAEVVVDPVQAHEEADYRRVQEEEEEEEDGRFLEPADVDGNPLYSE